jgi:hypothetical protein
MKHIIYLAISSCGRWLSDSLTVGNAGVLVKECLSGLDHAD